MKSCSTSELKSIPMRGKPRTLEATILEKRKEDSIGKEECGGKEEVDLRVPPKKILYEWREALIQIVSPAANADVISQKHV